MLKYLYPRPTWLLWWSGGVTSAIAVKEAIEIAGPENCRIIFIDTYNEHADTYRFKEDCEKWYGIPIETASRIPDDYKSIVDVWILNCSLNVAHGAICSSELKREIRYRIMAEYTSTINIFVIRFLFRFMNSFSAGTSGYGIKAYSIRGILSK